MKISLYFAVLFGLIIVSCSPNKTFYISNQYTDCIHIKSANCLQIKEKIDDEWEVFEGRIEGFEYERGHEYKLKVKEIKDDSSYPYTRYNLVKIVLDTIKIPDVTVNTTYPEGNKYVVKSLKDLNIQKLPRLYFTIKDGKISGFSGCNLFNGSVLLKKDGTFEIKEPLVSTKKACAGSDVNQLESTFLSELTNVKRFKIADGRLDLFDESNRLLISCFLMRG